MLQELNELVELFHETNKHPNKEISNYNRIECLISQLFDYPTLQTFRRHVRAVVFGQGEEVVHLRHRMLDDATVVWGRMMGTASIPHGRTRVSSLV